MLSRCKELVYEISIPSDELNHYERIFRQYEIVLKKINFADPLDKQKRVLNDLKKMKINLGNFLRKFDKNSFMVSFKNMEIGTDSFRVVPNMISEINAIEMNRLGNEKMLGDLDKDFEEMNAQLELITNKKKYSSRVIKKPRKETKKLSLNINHDIGRHIFKKPPPIIVNNNFVFKKPPIIVNNSFDPKSDLASNSFKNSVLPVESFKFQTDQETRILEEELEKLEEEEDNLENYLKNINNKNSKNNYTAKNDKYKIYLDEETLRINFKNKKLNDMIYQIEKKAKNENRSKLQINENTFISSEFLKIKDIMKYITQMQEKIILLKTELNNLKKDYENIDDEENHLNLILKNNSKKVINDERVGIELEINTYYYNKVLIYQTELNHLNFENKKLKKNLDKMKIKYSKLINK